MRAKSYHANKTLRYMTFVVVALMISSLVRADGVRDDLNGPEIRSVLKQPDAQVDDALDANRDVGELPPIPEPTEARERQSARGELGIRAERDDRGVIVQGVIVGAAGNKAGIQPGDRIVAIDGQPIDSADEIDRIVESMAAGDVCEVELQRNGATQTVSAALEPHVGYYDDQLPNSMNADAADQVAPNGYRREGAYYQPHWTYRPYYQPRYEYYPAPYYGPRYHEPIHYGRYYGTPGIGYRDYGWGRGGVHVGRLHIHW